MTYFRKQNFSEMLLNVPKETYGVDQRFSLDAGKYNLNGSKHKPLRLSEHQPKIEAFLSKNKRNGFDFNKLLVPQNEDVFSNQLKILILKARIFLHFVEEYKLKPKYDLGETVIGCLKGGFQFNSDYYKKTQADTRAYLRGETNLVYQDFPATHLLPWIDEEPIGESYVFKDPIPMHEVTFNRTKACMQRSIMDDALLRDLDVIDALYLLDQKKTNHMDHKGRTKTNFEARGDELDISYPEKPILDYEFKKVTTDACTSRVAGLLTVRGRNISYAAHSNIDKITFNDYDHYKLGLEPNKYVNLLSKDEGHFIMIDFKKSGLTTNREVIKSVYDVAIEHYPGFKPFAYYRECLENVMVNGLNSKRGTSLGMDDNCISFFLSCAFEAWLENRPGFQSKISWAKFKGDDQIIKTNCSYEDTNRIFISWVKCLSHLGFLINAKKSFIGVRGQFCEIVGRGDSIDTKAIEFGLNCIDALGSYNIIEFKIYLNALMKAKENVLTVKKVFDYCMTTAINSVEAEFTELERFYPFEMGGYFCEYENFLNVFIVKCLEGAYNEAPHMLFRLIGWDFPEQAWNWRRKKDIITTEFKDVKTMFDKLKKFAAKPMSPAWKESFDRTLEERKKMYYDQTPFLVGAKLQKLIDFKNNFALPLQYLEKVSDDRFVAYVPPARRRQMKGRQLREQKKSNQLIKIFDKKYYYIDEIRAKLLIKSVDTHETYGIKYHTRLPTSTIIWSLCKTIARSKWAIPIDWADWINMHELDVDRVWGYYRGKGIDLYHYKIRTDVEPTISLMFRGPAHSDLLCFDPYSGLPVRFNSSDYVTEVYERKIKNANAFYLDITQTYFKEFMFNTPRLMAWWGNNYRNKPFDPQIDYERITYVSDEIRQRMEWYPGQELCPAGVDPQVFFWYYETMIELTLDEDKTIQELPLNILVWNPEDLAKFSEEEYGSLHDSGSDIQEEYFRNNPLDSQSAEEEDPYLHQSEDTDVDSD